MKKWTEAEITQLKQLVDERKTANQIAIIMGKTPTSINTTKIRYGIRKPMPLSHNNPLHLAEVIKFKMAGWTLEEIGKVYGCTLSHVSHLLIANGMVRFMINSKKHVKPYNYWSELDLALLRKYLRKGYSHKHISMYFPNRTRHALHSKIGNITRYWLTPEQQAERKRLRANHMKWRVW